MEKELLLSVHDLKKSFGEREILKGISFDVRRGDVVCIIGPSGSGKSTLIRCVNYLEHPTAGTIDYRGTDVNEAFKKLTMYRTKVGMVFQSFNLFNNMTVLENCMVGQVKVLGKSKEEARTTALKYLKHVGMDTYVNAKPHQLSGGQKQRVAIAGVVAMEPKCIVFDEPTAMLDPNGRKEVIATAHELNKKKGVTIILITHYMEEVVGADHVYVMEKGKVVMDGTPREIFSRVDELKEHRLDVPQVTLVADELKKAGLDIPDGILTREELVNALVALKNR